MGHNLDRMFSTGVHILLGYVRDVLGPIQAKYYIWSL